MMNSIKDNISKEVHGSALIIVILITSIILIAGLSIDAYKYHNLKILSTTNYYEINCLKPTMDLDIETFSRCKELGKINKGINNESRVEYGILKETGEVKKKTIIKRGEINE
jgi:hypothetical protein